MRLNDLSAAGVAQAGSNGRGFNQFADGPRQIGIELAQALGVRPVQGNGVALNRFTRALTT